MNWQKTLQTIKQHAFPRKAALERELSAARAENQTLSTELEGVRAELQSTHRQDEQQIAELRQQLGKVQSEHDAANHQVRLLEASLEQAGQRQASTEAQLGSLENSLEQERHQVQQLEVSLEQAGRRQADTEDKLRSLENTLEQERSQVQRLEASLEQAGRRHAATEDKLGSLEDTLEQERSQMQRLEDSLQQAGRHQADTEDKLRSLEGKLEQERRQHEAGLDMSRKTFARLQTEQQNLLSLQSDQARTFNEIGRQLLESMQAVIARPPRPLFQIMAISGLLFLCGTLAGAISMRGFQKDGGELAELAKLNLGLRDMQVSIEQSFDDQNEIMTGLMEALNRETEQADLPEDGSLMEDVSEETPVSAPVDTSVVTKPDRQSAYGKWGPLLLMEDTRTAETAGELEFDPEIKEQQANLMVLGFNLGQRQPDGLKGRQTERALEEFRLLYLPLAGIDVGSAAGQLTPVIKRFADAARNDAKTYNVDSGVLAAIRLGSMHTEVDFSFLMELAAAESSFNPLSRARTSTAAGLYQFKDTTWLESVRKYGDKYGIGMYASQVEEVVDSKGKARPVIHDPAVLRHVLKLRHNPRIAALLAAEYVKKNMQRLLYSLDRKPGRTELYLTHFLGASGAISFLKAFYEDPDRIAHDIFPSAASRNKSIFRKRDSKPRTLAEIYEIFSRKFNTSRYEEELAGG
jgi:predicted  nucleic acid-binding Zn-ribbon protein